MTVEVFFSQLKSRLLHGAAGRDGGGGFGCHPWREREDGEDGGQREHGPQRLCDYITVIMKRLKQQSSILWGLQGNCVCVKKAEITSSLPRVRDSKRCATANQEGEIELLARVMRGKNKNGKIRKSPV